MDLDRYHDAAADEMHWCLDQLQAEGIEALWRSCIKLGAIGLDEIIMRRSSEISDFLSAPHDERTKRLTKMADTVERHGFLIAATHDVRCGYAWLDIACRYGISAGYNPPASFLLGQSSMAARELVEAFPSLWPFEGDPEFPDPFGPGEP